MATENEQQVKEFAEIQSAEMMQIQGGATVDYFLKVDTIEGEATNSATLWGEGKKVRIDFCK